MQSEETQSAWFAKAQLWAESHVKQIVWGVIVVLAAALIAGIAVWREQQQEAAANSALSRVTTGGILAGAQNFRPEDLLKVAEDFSGTDAGSRALLLAGTEFFTAGKYAEAQAQFEKYLRDYRERPLAGTALLGVAASLEAQGKIEAAMASYQNIADRRGTDAVALPAKFALARLYESQNKPEQARALYEELARSHPYTSIGSEAGMRYEELISKNPELANRRAEGVTAPGMNLPAQ